MKILVTKTRQILDKAPAMILYYRTHNMEDARIILTLYNKKQKNN